MGNVSAAVLVFARKPVAGEVKSRLIPVLGAERAAALHMRLLERTMAVVCAAGASEVQLWVTPDGEHVLFREASARFGWQVRTQYGGDLGARMRNAFDATLASSTSALLIGSDIPELAASDLVAADRALCRGEAALGPARDGGYYLIGLTREQARRPGLLSGIFSGMSWASATVADDTRARLRVFGIRWSELATRSDVDRPEDLRQLPGALRTEFFEP